MTLRWSISKDRRPRANLDVRFRLSPDYLVRAFALTRPEPGDTRTRREVEAMLRDQLYERGRARLDYWTDEIDESFTDEISSAVWAFEEVRRLWPEHAADLDDDLGELVARWRERAAQLADDEDNDEEEDTPHKII